MIQAAVRLFATIETLFFIGAVFIFFILRFKDKGGPLKKAMLLKYAYYFLIVNGFLVAALLGKSYFYPVMLVIVLLSLREFLGLMPLGGSRSFYLIMAAGAAIFLCAAYGGPAWFYPSIFFAVIPVLLVPIVRNDTKSAVLVVTSSVLALIYTSFLLTHVVLIYKMIAGIGYVAFLFAVLTMNDAFAELFGRSLGKKGFLPKISPNKTIIGSIGGLIAAAVGAALFGFLMPDKPFNFALTGSLVIGMSGQIGDLVASAFKRDLAVKDFSDFLPGHGGVLDRFDSLVLAAPAFYYFLRLTS